MNYERILTCLFACVRACVRPCVQRQSIARDPATARRDMAAAGQAVNQHLKFRPAREDLYQSRIMVNRHDTRVR